MFPPGPLPPGYTTAPTLLPFRPDFTDVSEELQVTVERDSVGFTREQATMFYPHAVSRGQVAQYTLAGDDIASLLGWFASVAGPGSSFWAAGCFNGGIVAQSAAADALTIQLEDSSAFLPGDYVCVFTDRLYTARIATLDPDSITLASPFGCALTTGEAILPLYLARLDKPRISISWKAPSVARVKLQWSEVRPELIPPSDETLGVTLGKLPTRIVLYEFARDFLNGTTTVDRFTNYETDLRWDVNVYQHRQLSHGDIKQSLNFEDDGVSLDSFIFTGNPLALDAALKSETPLSLTVRHADFDGQNLSDVRVVFTGELDSIGRKGLALKPKFKAGPATLDDQFPRMLRGPVCNHVAGANPDGSFLISYGCGLLKSDWKFTATVAESVSGAFPYTLNLQNLARVAGPVPTIFLDWFAYGWVEIGAGASVQRRLIIKSTVPASGTLSLTLHRGFETLPAVGAAVTLYPGCDGTPKSCKAYNDANNPLGKFDNYPNFGAEPFIPNGNPSLVKLAAAPASGAKK